MFRADLSTERSVESNTRSMLESHHMLRGRCSLSLGSMASAQASPVEFVRSELSNVAFDTICIPFYDISASFLLISRMSDHDRDVLRFLMISRTTGYKQSG
jgi:hypothetical protein